MSPAREALQKGAVTYPCVKRMPFSALESLRFPGNRDRRIQDRLQRGGRCWAYFELKRWRVR